MNTLKNAFTIVLVLIPILISGQNQSSSLPDKGLTVSIQDSDLGIMIPFFLSDRFVLAPGFQFAYASKIGTDIILGLSTKAFLRDRDKVCPYWGLKAGVCYYNPDASGTSNQIDFVLGGAVGVEYFFNQNFSIGIEPQLNFTLSDDESDRFGNPGGTGINTATMLTANIYF
ncbi:MAG: hypothetical protein RBT02_10375 [Bacteroidales bacterium]|jgi:hypothetical protein|nr:hypothetical protein [Bacteroidales bacterium]